METFHNIVDGKAVAAADGRTLDIVDPSTGEVYATSPLSGPDDVDTAFRSARTAYRGDWGATTPSDRMNALLAIADAVQENAEELVEIEHRDTGKPKGLTMSEEIGPMVDQFRFFAGAARHLQGMAAAQYMAGHESYVRREPLGVVGAVTPWNYPMMMATWKIGPALAAGNTLVIKPSDTTPASTVRMGELFAEILPPGVLNVVCGDRSTGAALAAHPIPAMVAITGSTAAGRAVAAATAKNVARAHLELGGNAPVVVFDDADVAAAAEAIAIAGFFNAGQDCTAASRVLASRAVADELAAALAEQAQAVRLSRDEEPDVRGPLHPADQQRGPAGQGRRPGRPAALARAGAHRRLRGRRGGVLLRAHGRRRGAAGRRDRPHEIFGPVITVQTFADEAEALELANDTPYGLASSVFTTDHSRRCGCRGRWSSAACGSTPTSRWWRRCRTAGSRSPATARTSRATRWRTTRASST